MERQRDGEKLVRPGEIPAGFPRPPPRSGARRRSGRALRQSGLLTGAALKTALVERAVALGFDVVRVTAAEAPPRARERLDAWLAEGHHGSMDWMAATAERRADPKTLWPEARSVVVLGVNYGPAEHPLAALAAKDRGAISVYARGRDYHDVIKGKLKELAGFLAARGGCDVKVSVDTDPVMDKPLA